MKLVRYGSPGQEQPSLIDATGAMRDLCGRRQPRFGPCVAGTGNSNGLA
ncbi:hypothetical protein N9H39_05225 [Gammaproteobacteria bacterium]|nr:hypothetical protein [Gammaproteobacteria bacterium]